VRPKLHSQRPPLDRARAEHQASSACEKTRDRSSALKRSVKAAEGPFLDHDLPHTAAPGMISHVVVTVVVFFAVVHMALFTMSPVVVSSPPTAVPTGRVTPFIAEAMPVLPILSVPFRVSVRPAIKPIPFEPLVPFTGLHVPFGVSLPVEPVSFMVLPVMLLRVAVWVLMNIALIRILVVAIPIVYMAAFATAVPRIMTELIVIVPRGKIGTAASTLAPGLLTVRTPESREPLSDISNIPVSMVSVPAIAKALILVPIMVASGRVAMISTYSISPISIGAAPFISDISITSISSI